MVAKLLQRPELLTPPRPGQDDKTADGEISGSPHGARPGGEEPTLEKYEERAARWPLTLVKNHLGASRVGQNLHELNGEFAIFKALPSEQDRVAATRLPPRARAQVGEGGGSLFHLACGQV